MSPSQLLAQIPTPPPELPHPAVSAAAASAPAVNARNP